MPIWRLKSLINKEFEKNSNLYINSRHLLHLVELKTAEMRFFAVGKDNAIWAVSFRGWCATMILYEKMDLSNRAGRRLERVCVQRLSTVYNLSRLAAGEPGAGGARRHRAGTRGRHRL